MAEESLAELLQRLEHERLAEDRRYNDALTALDAAVPATPAPPPPPAPYDDSQLPPLNEHWDIVARPPAFGGLKGRLRRFIWNLVGPIFGAQQRFNATLVDHLNRNVTVHQEARQAAAAVLEAIQQSHVEALARHTHLIRYLQTITPYVDSRDRAVGGLERVMAAGLSAVAEDALKRSESAAARDQRFMARVAALDDVRATATLAQQTALSLKRQVERLAAGPASDAQEAGPGPGPGESAVRDARPELDAFKYVEFEDSFRGSQQEIRDRLADYVNRFAGLSDVLDIGCGRGEFLALLADHGITARGVDLNPEMVEASRARGLDVRHGDALGHLRDLEDASLGGIFGAQVAEHLEPWYLEQLVETALHKIRPGGLLVLETINPTCWAAFFDSYLRDLTHVRALHPETLQFVVRAGGFHSVEIEYRSPVPEHARLEAVPVPEDLPPGLRELVRVLNDNLAKLNARMFTYQDYAVFGRK